MRNLILGGARSGKSRLAEQLASSSGLPVTYIATCEARDGEMNERVRLHRERRPADWGLIEEPLALAKVLHAQAGEDADRDLVHAGPLAPLQGGQVNRQAFELAEGTGGLGQLLLTGAGLVHGGGVEGLAGITPPHLGHRAGPLSMRGRPATVSTTRWQRSATAWCNSPAWST